MVLFPLAFYFSTSPNPFNARFFIAAVWFAHLVCGLEHNVYRFCQIRSGILLGSFGFFLPLLASPPTANDEAKCQAQSPKHLKETSSRNEERGMGEHTTGHF